MNPTNPKKNSLLTRDNLELEYIEGEWMVEDWQDCNVDANGDCDRVCFWSHVEKFIPSHP